MFIGVNALDYSGYPDCRPEYIRAYEQMANLATKAGVEGRQHLRIHTPLIELTKAQIIQRGLALGVDYSLTHSCYDPDPAWSRLRDLRLVPAAPSRVRRSRPGGPGAQPGAGAGGMTYRVKEIFYTLQGEGTHVGRPAVFCRFTSCNLWTGREKDRARAICQFCDTDFVGTDGPGGGRFATARDLACGGGCHVARSGTTRGRARSWCARAANRCCSLTWPPSRRCMPPGSRWRSRPTALRKLPPGLDWICVSPKAGAPLKLVSGDELKLVYPQEGADPELFEDLDFPRLLLQPMDGPEREKNTRLAVEYCLAHPQWRLSLQTHKYLGIA